MRDDRPATELDVAAAVSGGVRAVGRVGDVDRDGRIGMEVESDHPRAAQADLLLDGAHPTHRRLGPVLARPTERLGGDPGPDAVVETDCHEARRGGREPLVDGERIAHLHEFAGLLLVLCADVHTHVVDLVDLVFLPEVDRRLSDHAGNDLVSRVDLDVLSARDGLGRAPDRTDVEEAAVVDPADDVADLVGVARDHDLRTAPVEPGDDVPVGVGAHLVGEPGGAGGGEKAIEESPMVVVHAPTFVSTVINGSIAGGTAKFHVVAMRRMADKKTTLLELNIETVDFHPQGSIGSLLSEGADGEEGAEEERGSKLGLFGKKGTADEETEETEGEEAGGSKLGIFGKKDEESEVDEEAETEIDATEEEAEADEDDSGSATALFVGLVVLVMLAVVAKKLAGSDDDDVETDVELTEYAD